MADEIENKTPAPEAEPEQPQLTAVEQRAVEQGWVPQDQWEGEPDQWRPAKEFLDRGELFKKIDDQNRTIKEFKKVVDDLRKHNAKIAEVEYKRALEQLKEQKKVAIAEGDGEAVVSIDERIDAVKEAQREVQAAPVAEVAQEVNPIFSAWVERNQWFNSNRAMRAFANDVGREAAAQGLSPSDVLAKVEAEVKKEFADKFNNPRRNAPGAVEASSNKGTSGKRDTFTLTDDERRVMRRIVATGALTEAQYIADLKKIKGVN